MSKKAPISDDDLYPDAWERFERAVKIVAKAPPMHRTKAITAKPMRDISPKPQPKRRLRKDVNQD
jgi:hypothetical protein